MNQTRAGEARLFPGLAALHRQWAPRRTDAHRMRVLAPVRSSRWAAPPALPSSKPMWNRSRKSSFMGAATLSAPLQVSSMSWRELPCHQSCKLLCDSLMIATPAHIPPPTWIWAMLAFAAGRRASQLPPNALRDATVSNFGCISSFFFPSKSEERQTTLKIVNVLFCF